MLIKDRLMKLHGAWLIGAVVVVVGAGSGCTRPNPAFCSDGSCIDPTLPFCDIDGSIGGQPMSCIAVTCTAGAFAACRGDDIALTCNATGDDYDEIKCDLGCDAASGGCRACMPSTTECANGAVSTCDAAGNVTAQTACPLGCFEDQPRCRDIDPSNGLATFLDMVADPPDLDLSMGGAIVTDTGVVTDSTNQPVAAMTFLVPGTAGAPSIRVVVARNVTLGNVSTVGNGLSPNPLAILATGDIRVVGAVSLMAGSLTSGTCVGGISLSGDNQAGNHESGGAGGGGNATAGGDGGTILDDGGQGTENPRAIGGTPTGTSAIVPLQGGCAAGGFHDFSDGTSATFGALGGGALQLSSRTSIIVTGSINASGTTFGAAGSAGGGILLEGPSVVLGPQGMLLAAGGEGAGCSPQTTSCSSGGVGATNDHAAGDGLDIEFSLSGSSAGNGGGGLGRLRVNTLDKTFATSNSSVQVGQLSTGVLSTR